MISFQSVAENILCIMKLFVILVILATKAFSLPYGIVDEPLDGEPAEGYAAFAESPSLASQELNDDVIAASENDEAPVYARTQGSMEVMGEDDMGMMGSEEGMQEDGMATMGSEDSMGSDEEMEMMGRYSEQEAEEMLADDRVGVTLQSDDWHNEELSQETDGDETDDQEMMSPPASISDGINDYYVD